MKKIVVLSGLVLASQAFASGYPSDYCNQSASVYSDGPALLARVGSGCMGSDVIGYRSSGVLAQDNPETISVIIVASCSLKSGEVVVKNSVEQLNREWHGTGYMTEELKYKNYYSDRCYGPEAESTGVSRKMALAFTANGKWDSANGANFINVQYGIPNTSTGRIVQKRTQNTGSNISMELWDLIINEMTY